MKFIQILNLDPNFIFLIWIPKILGHIQKSYLWFFWIGYFRLTYRTQYLCTTVMGHKGNHPHSLTEPQLVYTTARLGKGSWLITFFHPDSLEPDTKCWNNGIKMDDHKSSKSWTSRFTIFVTKLYTASHPKDHNVIFLYFPSNSCVPATAHV